MAIRRKPRRSRELTERAKLDATPPWEGRRVRDEAPPTTGPYDVADAPDDDVPRVDLGALRIPLDSGLDLSMEVNENRQVGSVTLAQPDGSMQLGLYAAPRNEGIWDEVRAEIAGSLRQQQGNPTERRDGRFGTELLGTVPAANGRIPVRFAGIDGPRWFLRAMFAGAPADPASADKFEDVLRRVVVVRGTQPLPVRDPVLLTLPKEVELPEDLTGGGPAGGTST